MMKKREREGNPHVERKLSSLGGNDHGVLFLAKGDKVGVGVFAARQDKWSQPASGLCAQKRLAASATSSPQRKQKVYPQDKKA
jgi:hypothetical protein